MQLKSLMSTEHITPFEVELDLQVGFLNLVLVRTEASERVFQPQRSMFFATQFNELTDSNRGIRIVLTGGLWNSASIRLEIILSSQASSSAA